ncbi:McrC family protein [Kitasatospora sp. NPDC094019]|uniref:McrC family protein n=1 Tax=Kitasatospora sp. NPDC094019 TaxID=3364091 RepID=UPI003817CCA6
MTVVHLTEHAPAVSVPLPDAAGRAVAASRILDTAAPDPYRKDHWVLRAGSKVGVVSLAVPGGDPLSVRINPKVPIARLFFLIGYSLDPRGWRDGDVEVDGHDEVLPALAHAVERQVDRALCKGALQGYRTVEESALVVRGRIREAEQMRRRFGAVLPVEIAYDEFTTDIAENRILRAAVERLLRLPGVPQDVRRRLLHQRSRLVDVSPLVRGQELPVWHATRLNARYHQALRLAHAVLGGSSPEHTAGELRIDGFLLNMNKLFEDFVTVALREAYRGTDRTCRLQDPHHLDEAGEIRMQPDFVLYGPEGAPQAVADAKYKVEKSGGYPDADLYQMLAYCTALGLREGHLVYAKGNAPHAAHRVRHAGVVIHQHALDLDRGPAGLLGEIRSLAHRMAPADRPEPGGPGPGRGSVRGGR